MYKAKIRTNFLCSLAKEKASLPISKATLFAKEIVENICDLLLEAPIEDFEDFFETNSDLSEKIGYNLGKIHGYMEALGIDGYSLGEKLDEIINMMNDYFETHSQLIYNQKQCEVYQGGIYVGEFDGKIYVVSKDEAKLNWNDAKEWCNKYTKDGYDDWFLPNKEELNFLYESNVIETPSSWYWSSTEYDSTFAWYQGFSGSYAGSQVYYFMTYNNSVRAMRIAK